jgi:hypothetical protein
MESNISDLIISWVRTVVPVLVGAVVTWAIRQGLISDAAVTQPLTEVLVLAISAAYYFVVRLLEKLNPIFGFFLGVPKTPTYTPPVTAVKAAPQHRNTGTGGY